MTSTLAQPGILAPLPRVGRYLFLSIAQSEQLRSALVRLAALADGEAVVVGLGPECLATLNDSASKVTGLRPFPALRGPQNGNAQDESIKVPATPCALLCWLRGTDTGQLVLLTHQIEQALLPALHLDRVVDGFVHHPAMPLESGTRQAKKGHDLTGYEDGTENPKGQKAAAAALVQGQGAGLDGASFMAVQQWLHDFNAFNAMKPAAQDRMVGRRRTTNEEMANAPKSAHVKRTEQESFAPPAFVLRRSMPWVAGNKAGLMFVAFGKTLDAFEVQMRRMVGEEDGVVDALFQMSKPVSGAYFWCPPVRNGRLDLRAL
jgi:putative iron-dependent peroxidase